MNQHALDNPNLEKHLSLHFSKHRVLGLVHFVVHPGQINCFDGVELLAQSVEVSFPFLSVHGFTQVVLLYLSLKVHVTELALFLHCCSIFN